MKNVWRKLFGRHIDQVTPQAYNRSMSSADKNQTYLVPTSIRDVLKENPVEAIEILRKAGVDTASFAKELSLSRKNVQSKYNLSDIDASAVEHVFWYAYDLEREVEGLIVTPGVARGADKGYMQNLVNGLTFSQKISILESIYPFSGERAAHNFFKILRKVQGLRNSVAHGRFSELKYKNVHLGDLDGQFKMIADLGDAMGALKILN